MTGVIWFGPAVAVMFAARFLLVGDAHPHAGGDALEHRVHILENVFGLDPHHPDANAFEALVAPLGERVVLPLFVNSDRHAETVAIEIDNRAADHSVAT